MIADLGFAVTLLGGRLFLFVFLTKLLHILLYFFVDMGRFFTGQHLGRINTAMPGHQIANNTDQGSVRCQD